MPEQTNEAPAPEVVAIYPDEETQALAEAQIARAEAMKAEAEKDLPRADEPAPQKDEAHEGGAQAEEVAASSDEGEGSPPASTDADATEEPTEPADLDLRGLPDEHKDRLLKAHNSGVLSAAEIAEQKELILKGMGFDKKMRELAELRKELEAKAARGEEFDRLFADADERDRFLAWKQQTETESEPEPLPTFDTDEDLVRFVEKRAAEIADKRIQEIQSQQSQAVEAESQAAQAMIGAVEAHYATLDGVSEDDYSEACQLLNAEIRADGGLPWEILKDADTVNRKIGPHLERVQLKRRLSDLEEQLKVKSNEQSKSEAARAAGLSSPVGRSTRSGQEFPDTPEGRVAKTMAELRGANLRDF